ncbi:SAF domain-containing protein [Priestia abyssalis]|uniref:SAF domain-containing protein n=1 Tax=Priestia abyssalis TaxID=1221450 RepID=UPI000995036C|nr:SAF domain-containing protein [Priestia abyssalis]
MLESKRKALIFLSLSFLLAVTAGILFLVKVKDLNTDLGGRTKVYVAAADIASRTPIKPGQVRTVELPNRFVIKDFHVTDVSRLVNKVSVVPMSEGDLITENVLKPISNVQNENNRLVAIFENEKVHFDEEVGEQDRVDIIVSHTFNDQPKTEVFMKDVLVSRLPEGKDFTGVAVEVSQEDAPKLIHMQNYAESIRILKANVGKEDQNQVKASAAPVEETKPAEEAAKQPAPTNPPAAQQQEVKPAPAQQPAQPAKTN